MVLGLLIPWVPADASQIEMSFFWHVLTFHDAPIQHPAFCVNMDQMQVVYQMGGGLTFDIIGSAQVPVLDLEEKHAFMLVVAVSAAGNLLPFSKERPLKALQVKMHHLGLKQKDSGSALSIL